MLKEEFIHAEAAWDVSKPMVDHRTTLVKLVCERLGLTEAEANAKLLTRIPSGKRKDSKAPATIVAYRYLKRAISHFYENLGKGAVKAFVSSINESTSMGKQIPVRSTKTRTVLTLTSEEAGHLRHGDRFIHEAYGHKALLSGAKNMIASITASGLFEGTEEGCADKTVVCLLAHMAFVVTKVREHLRHRAHGGSAPALMDTVGMNEGHREPWLRELVTLDAVYWRLSAASNGLRLIDAASPARASAVRIAGPVADGASSGGGDAAGIRTGIQVADAAAAGVPVAAAAAGRGTMAAAAAGGGRGARPAASAVPGAGRGAMSTMMPDGGLLEDMD